MTEATKNSIKVPEEALAGGIELLQENVFVFGARGKEKKSGKDTDDNHARCSCDVTNACAGPSTCLNWASQQECRLSCQCGSKCRNQRLQRRQYACVEVVPAGAKGWGVVARAPIKKGALVLEYIGEVMSTSRAIQRLEGYLKDPRQVHTYLMSIMGSEKMIDATRKGGVARFINHSCDPNCTSETWEAAGEQRVGIFALRDIAVGEEVHYDYSLEYHGLSKHQVCACGAAKCRGFIVGASTDAAAANRRWDARLRHAILSEWTLPTERKYRPASAGPGGEGEREAQGPGEEGRAAGAKRARLADVWTVCAVGLAPE